jgi:hypothetical protein
MQINTLSEIRYRPSEPAKKILRKLKAKYPKRTFTDMVDEAVILLKK